MNPARSLGPALVSGAMDSLLLYLTATLAGAVLGAAAYTVIFSVKQPRRRKAEVTEPAA
jgi:glycerol uptake facilitator-like aquaporin